MDKPSFHELLERLESKGIMSALSSLQLQNLPQVIPNIIHITVECEKLGAVSHKMINCQFNNSYDMWIVKIELDNIPSELRSMYLVQTLLDISELCPEDDKLTISGLESLSLCICKDDIVNDLGDDDVM